MKIKHECTLFQSDDLGHPKSHTEAQALCIAAGDVVLTWHGDFCGRR